ncbi:hypothetical protein ABIE45_002590 [Methylobacterium sp. OAE515]
MALATPRYRSCKLCLSGAAYREAKRTIFCLTPQHRYLAYEQPVVLPQVSHFRQVPFRTSVKFAHSGHNSPP